MRFMSIALVLFNTQIAWSSQQPAKCTVDGRLSSTKLLKLAGPYAPLICKQGSFSKMSSRDFETVINSYYQKHEHQITEPAMLKLEELRRSYDSNDGASKFNKAEIDQSDRMIEEVKAFVQVEMNVNSGSHSDKTIKTKSSR